MGERVGLIAGSGIFPCLAAKELEQKGKRLFIIAVEPEAAERLRPLAEVLEVISPGAVGEMLHFLQENQVSEVLLAGKINPVRILKSGEFDELARELLGRLPVRNASTIIEGFINFLQAQGIEVMDPSPFLQPYFCEEGFLTRQQASPDALADVEIGFNLARPMADLEVGQTVVVKGKIVVAVEAMEGTDDTIRRAGELAGEGVSVVKVGRSQQKMMVDVPAVGLQTIHVLLKVRAACLCLEAGRVAFFDRSEALPLAEEGGLAILARRGRDLRGG